MATKRRSPRKPAPKPRKPGFRDMAEEHLRNAVSFVARRAAHGLSHAPWMLQTLVDLIEECERRGFRV